MDATAEFRQRSVPVKRSSLKCIAAPAMATTTATPHTRSDRRNCSAVVESTLALVPNWYATVTARTSKKTLLSKGRKKRLGFVFSKTHVDTIRNWLASGDASRSAAADCASAGFFAPPLDGDDGGAPRSGFS